MYLYYCFLLLVGLYTMPAIALFPRLAQSPKTAFAIPVISAGVVYLVVTGLQLVGLYTQGWVQFFAMVMVLVGLTRVIRLRTAWNWPVLERWFYLFGVCFILPYLFKLGMEAFERGDEIYSWNFWAIQHMLGQPIDFSHTGATYPQLFPKLLSFGYYLMGSSDLQCPNKAMLGLFSGSLLMGLGAVLMPLNPRKIFIYGIMFLWLVVGTKLEQFFNDGYADPIMASALVASMAFLMLFRQAHEKQERDHYLIMATWCAVVGCLTKQPGLMWAFFLAAYLVVDAIKNKQTVTFICLLGLSLSIGLWLSHEGQGFQNNQGVIYLSFEGRGLIEQLVHSLNHYMIQKPLIGALFVLGAWLTRRDPFYRTVFWLYIIPATALWLIFAAYQLRLGQHLLSMVTLLCLCQLKHPNRLRHEKVKALLRWSIRRQTQLRFMMIGLCVVACSGVYLKKSHENPGVDYLNGPRVALTRYFEADADKIYEAISNNPSASLWVPSRYLYGLFYEKNELMTPDYSVYQPYNEQALVSELRKKQPDFVFTVSNEVIDGQASDLLRGVIQKCPDSFDVFAVPPNKFDYTTYRVIHESLNNDSCLNELAYEVG